MKLVLASLALLSCAAIGLANPPAAVQKVTVTVDNGFSPESVTVKLGTPVELTFIAKNPGCASTVVFKSLHLSKTLTKGKKTVFSFTPKTTGPIEYACGMDMIHGTVLVK